MHFKKIKKFTLTTKAEAENIYFKFKKLDNYLYGSKKKQAIISYSH